MRTTMTTVTVVCAVLAVAGHARAQDSRGEEQPPRTAAITPYISQGSPTASRFGVAVRWPIVSPLSVELETGYRRGELHALSFNASILCDLPTIGVVTPYVAGGIGLEQYGVAVESGDGKLGTMAKTAFTVNAGAGVQVPLGQKVGVRTDARWFNGIGGSSPESWRVYNGLTIGQGKR